INDYFAAYISPPTVNNVIYNPVIHELFAKLIVMKDRTHTTRRTETLVNYALHHFTAEDFRRILLRSKTKCREFAEQQCPDIVLNSCAAEFMEPCMETASYEECEATAIEQCTPVIEEQCGNLSDEDCEGIANQVCWSYELTAGQCDAACVDSCDQYCDDACQAKIKEACMATGIENISECTQNAVDKCLPPCKKTCSIPFTKEELVAIEAEAVLLENGERKLDDKLAAAIDLKKVMPVPAEKILATYRKLINMQAPAPLVAEGTVGPGYVKPESQKYDGTIRTAAPASSFFDQLYLHIDMLLAMRYFGIVSDDLEFHLDKVIMHNCKYPGEDKTTSITIPLINNGTMLVNWAGRYYEPDQFEHRSFKTTLDYAINYNLLKKPERGE
ncbi:MAG: hypothetical protein KAG97_13545, partial [Victivallales bacterium]|nr:hypothetical protein [Victivallales bacterium]